MHARYEHNKMREAGLLAMGFCRCGKLPDIGRKTCQLCLNKQAERRNRNKNAGLCQCGRDKPVDGYKRCIYCIEQGRIHDLTDFLAALDHYGGRQCTQCKTTELSFLTLDHIKNDGYEVRRNNNNIAGVKLASKLRNLGYPQDAGIQILCWNCQLGKLRNRGVLVNNNIIYLCDCVTTKPCLHNLSYDQRKRRKLCLRTFQAYGGSECVRCHEINPFYLTIEHSNGDGKEHHKVIGKDIYTWLRRNNYPQDLGLCILCANCNSSVGSIRNLLDIV